MNNKWLSIIGLLFILGLSLSVVHANDIIKIGIVWDAPVTMCNGKIAEASRIKGYRIYADVKPILSNSNANEPCVVRDVDETLMIANESDLPGSVVSAEIEYVPGVLKGIVYFRVVTVSDTGHISAFSNQLEQPFDFTNRTSAVVIRFISPLNVK